MIIVLQSVEMVFFACLLLIQNDSKKQKMTTTKMTMMNDWDSDHHLRREKEGDLVLAKMMVTNASMEMILFFGSLNCWEALESRNRALTEEVAEFPLFQTVGQMMRSRGKQMDPKKNYSSSLDQWKKMKEMKAWTVVVDSRKEVQQ